VSLQKSFLARRVAQCVVDFIFHHIRILREIVIPKRFVLLGPQLTNRKPCKDVLFQIRIERRQSKKQLTIFRLLEQFAFKSNLGEAAHLWLLAVKLKQANNHLINLYLILFDEARHFKELFQPCIQRPEVGNSLPPCQLGIFFFLDGHAKRGVHVLVECGVRPCRKLSLVELHPQGMQRLFEFGESVFFERE